MTPSSAEITAAIERAARLFEVEGYYEAHEVLEEFWLRAESWDRAFLHGLIQMAGALHLARNHFNPRAARRLFARALAKWAWLPDTYHGLLLRRIERDVLAALDERQRLPLLPLIAWQSVAPTPPASPTENLC